MSYHYSTFNLCPSDFEVDQTKVKGGCQSGRIVVTHDSKSDLPLALIFMWPGLVSSYSTKMILIKYHFVNLILFL